MDADVMTLFTRQFHREIKVFKIEVHIWNVLRKRIDFVSKSFGKSKVLK